MSYIKNQIRKQVKPHYDELKRTAKSVFGIHKSADELVAETKFAHYLLVKRSIQTGQDVYEIFDVEENLVYRIKGTFWLGRHHLNVYRGNEKIGEIRKKLIALPDIDEGHSKRHLCEIYLDGKEVNSVEAFMKSRTQGLKPHKTQEFRIHKHGWTIRYNPDDDSYALQLQKKLIAQLNEATSKKFVIAYNDVEKELDVVLLSIAFFQINNAIMKK